MNSFYACLTSEIRLGVNNSPNFYCGLMPTRKSEPVDQWRLAYNHVSDMVASKEKPLPPQQNLANLVRLVYEENQRYFSDKKKETTMVEYWVPPEERTWQASTTPKTSKSGQKVQKVKELPKETQRKCGPGPLPPGVSKMAENLKTKTGSYLTKARTWYAKLRANKVAPIHTKVQSRHLELEPLCCLSSCLVRGGCMTVVVFEMAYIAYTLLYIVIGMSRGGFTLWEPLPKNFNGWIGHHFFFYCIVLYDIALFIVATGLAQGLYSFNRFFLKAHFYFCFVSLAVNIIFLTFAAWALCSPGAYTFNILNSLLIWCFAMQIPLQIWAITVVKSCFDFFGLIHVFVSLAES